MRRMQQSERKLAPVCKKWLAVILVCLQIIALAPFVFAETEQFPASGLPEVHISLAEGLTLETVNTGSKDTKYPGNTVTLVSADGTEDTTEDVELKGRGNYTWNQPRMLKKPYQLKFPSKKSVFGMEKAKKWILLANQTDGTLMRNKLVFDLAEALEMPFSPQSVWVDVFVNDEYIGNYLLCEKNEIGASRVNLKDDFGVLCEVDGNSGLLEPHYFRTEIDQTIVVLSDSVADDIDQENSVSSAAFLSIQAKLNQMEALLYDTNATWDQIAALIDVDSFINYYFIQELTEDPDGCRSSFFLYTDGESDVIHLGPVWDYDSALGAYAAEKLGGNPLVDYTLNIRNYMGQTSVNWFRCLFLHEEFCNLAAEAYETRIKPLFATIPQRIAAYLSDGEMPTAFSASAANNFVRWNNVLGTPSMFGNNGHPYGETFAEEVDYLTQWLNTRVAYLNARGKISPMELTQEEPGEPVTEPSEPPTEPEPQPQPEENANKCPWCGKVHEGFFQSIIGFFHSILAKLFGKRS